MNKKQKQIITAADLIEVLRERQNGYPISPLVVVEPVEINREKCNDFRSIQIDEVTFTGPVTIEGFLHQPSLTISSRASIFRGGLVLENNSGSRIDLLGGFAKFLYFQNKNQFGVVGLCGLTIKQKLGLSGLQLRDNLRVEDTAFSELELCSHQSSENITVPKVITNNPWVTDDFRLAMVPVFRL